MSGLKVGDGVTAYFYLNCGHCRYCLANLEPLCVNSGGNVGLECDGGYAEYIKLPAHIFIKYPEGLDYKAHPAEMGVITDALATPYKVLRRAQVKAGETVAVIGAGGGLGIHQVMMAKWANARVIAVESAADKFDACRKAGADEVVNPRDGDVVEALRDLTHGAGVDVVDRLRRRGRDAGSRRQGAGPARPAGHSRRRRAAVPGAGARHAARRSRRSSAAAMSRAPRFWRPAIWWRAAKCGRW